DQPPGGDLSPEAEVDGVAPDHPAQVEVPALARRAVRGVGEEETDGGALGDPPRPEDRAPVESEDPGDRTRQERRDGRLLLAQLRLEERPDGPRLGTHPRDRVEESGRVPSPVEAVPEAGERAAGEAAEVIDAIDGGGRGGAERGEDPADVVLDRRHLAVRE